MNEIIIDNYGFKSYFKHMFIKIAKNNIFFFKTMPILGVWVQNNHFIKKIFILGNF